MDYKIASKVLDQSLHDKIPKLVSLNQTGFVKGRCMNDTIRTLHDIVDFCKFTNTGGLLLMIDFEKAFNTLEWDFLFQTLEKMNFGQSFINWVKLFYNDIESCVSNNGVSSQYFKLERGVRQGDPLSAYLFILCMEIMSSSILRSDAIQGLTINSQEIKLLQYADDTTAVLKNQQSVKEFISLITKFGELSGLKINTQKTEALWLGDVPPFKLPNNIKWSNKPIKVLGAYIGWNLQDDNRLTISKKIIDMRKMLFPWKHRKLTLNGRVLILKSLAVSQIIHLASLLPFPDDLSQEIEQMIYEFLWNGKTHKVKKDVIIQDFKEGGHKMIDIRSLIMTQKLK